MKHKDGKIKVNLTLEPGIVEMGDKLAKRDRRSLSNLVEVLLERKFLDEFGDVKAPTKQAA